MAKEANDPLNCLLQAVEVGESRVDYDVNAPYERGAMILTSNRSISQWGDVFGGGGAGRALGRCRSPAAGPVRRRR